MWQDTADLPAGDAIARQGEVVLDQLLGMPGLLDAWIEFLRHPESRARFGAIYDESKRRLAVTIRTGIRTGQLARCNAPALAATLTAIIEGLMLQVLVDTNFDAHRHWRAAWQLLRSGVAATSDR